MQTSPFRTVEERKVEREQKREAVLRAAVRLFNTHGFHAASLDDVAASLGVSKPTIYHYLGNKDQVLFECVTRGIEQLRDAASAAREHPGSGLDRLRSFLRHYAEITMGDFGRCVIRTSDEVLSAESADRFRELKREIDGAMRALIAEGIADGSIAPVNVKLAAFTLAGALNWPARWHRTDGGESAETVATQMVDILTGGLAPR
ncbi:TetR/AcrR family transcriptional regulator [Sphingomonas cavernae]|uniref:TetR/AcrR family transcriptional regulator n=1 Tax=Sphingomonas cavernae TaxID=2320861 RepID=A0A418WMS2_9SPHN|nr:TetR/AcrR family transcriptional regulator [Sphingomonas cavernae]RJF91298.1 TetR/AcrR family transcriptional regulator [Sphingomonas cavernae]